MQQHLCIAGNKRGVGGMCVSCVLAAERAALDTWPCSSTSGGQETGMGQGKRVWVAHAIGAGGRWLQRHLVGLRCTATRLRTWASLVRSTLPPAHKPNYPRTCSTVSLLPQSDPTRQLSNPHPPGDMCVMVPASHQGGTKGRTQWSGVTVLVISMQVIRFSTAAAAVPSVPHHMRLKKPSMPTCRARGKFDADFDPRTDETPDAAGRLGRSPGPSV